MTGNNSSGLSSLSVGLRCPVPSLARLISPRDAEYASASDENDPLQV